MTDRDRQADTSTGEDLNLLPETKQQSKKWKQFFYNKIKMKGLMQKPYESNTNLMLTFCFMKNVHIHFFSKVST
jgi:hypothetical protein